MKCPGEHGLFRTGLLLKFRKAVIFIDDSVRRRALLEWSSMKAAEPRTNLGLETQEQVREAMFSSKKYILNCLKLRLQRIRYVSAVIKATLPRIVFPRTFLSLKFQVVCSKIQLCFHQQLHLVLTQAQGRISFLQRGFCLDVQVKCIFDR